MIKSDFVLCQGIQATKSRAGASLLQHLREVGGEFYFVKPDAPMPNPEVEIETTGDLSLVGIAHPTLRPGSLDFQVTSRWLNGRGNASITFLASSRQPMFYQAAFVKDTKQNDSLLSAHRLFMEQLLPLLKPKFAWLDASGDSVPGAGFVKRVELKRLFWTMFLGPDFVKKYGRDFFAGAPVWRAEDFGNDGILLTTTEKYTDWLAGPDEALVKYFATKAPGIKRYRYKPIP